MKKKDSTWPKATSQLAKELHLQLRLDEKNWHKYKSNADRRAAELLAGALVQLLQNGKPSDIEALTTQGLLWLKREIKDPGCPHH